ncbi:LysR family transcriptional regulator [Nocardioides sp. zg-DK7169]|uniref:LysR family transcriptional regulator n=1 Tax=Nocardioides sp. zg-DK7169 TaxID=2736600 RepID=UPI001553D555|nr:LysR substrate-binding domain-containing protein [Nocardioides sp. zg-DK7169]NPC96943.1 LysR family transcriptional regulator [Nocardioides sp. zg-DK7169]
MSRPDLVALDLLVRVAETGSLGAAARALGMAQPNASRAIQRLERQLGLALVVRTPSGSRLTTEGEVVVSWAREALEATDRIVLGARSLAAQRAAQLTVSASLTIAEHLAPAWLARFAATHPDLHVSLRVGNSVQVLAALRSGEVPLGFVESPGVPAGFAASVVATDALVVVVGRTHPWARRRTPLGAAELAAAELVLREEGSGTRDTLARALGDAGVELGPARLELASTAAVTAAAVAGGAAVLSELAVAAEVAAGRLVVVEVDGLDLRRRLRAVWLRERRPDGAAAELVRVARAVGRPG